MSRRRANRASWRDRIDSAGSHGRRVPSEPRPIVVSPRYKRYLDAQRERLFGVDALGHKVQTEGDASAIDS